MNGKYTKQNSSRKMRCQEFYVIWDATDQSQPENQAYR